MSTWSAGYMSEIEYLSGYYAELNPLRTQLAFLKEGLVPPNVKHACELGFGQGVTVNIHGASSNVNWYGTDFNPAQTAFAQEMSAATGATLTLSDAAFEEYCQDDSLPGFDFIALHGIWSWISDDNRHVIVDFLRRKLNVGGVVYLGYNTEPGWSAFAPIRNILADHAKTMGAKGTSVISRVDDAISFVNKLMDVNPAFAKANPGLKKRLENLTAQDRKYLAHEYFNEHWHPMQFGEMATWLEDAKLSFACSAHYLDHIDGINLTSEQQELLSGIEDPTFQQSVRDIIVNQQFRRDYWVKGARKLNPVERLEAIRKQRIVLTVPRPDVKLEVKGNLGKANMSEKIYVPILNSLADHQPKTIAQIEEEVKEHDIGIHQLVEAVMVLGAGNVAPVQDDEAVSQTKKRTDQLNRYLCKKAQTSNQITTLASPVTGGGLPVIHIEQLFIEAINSGDSQPAQWAAHAWQHFAIQGQRIVKDGKPLQSEEENLAELTERAKRFEQKRLPMLKALKVIPG
ncbi:MAG: class I SAM-dependent methyltransferase [Pseudohongiella nitratireducens]|nr:class I SAM-dependent methyltransferase [Pseudohongiella nitratireducens]MDF1621972.1 class I SAM-dependent methyltransferase [Pseudohongiella nitratireducens]